MVLVPPEDYPKVREIMGVDDEEVSDAAMEEAALIAEDRINAKIPGASAETDPTILGRYQRAARLITAGILARQMAGYGENVTSLRLGDSTLTTTERNWLGLWSDWDAMGWEILGPYLPQTPATGSVFRLSRTARRAGRCTW